MDIIQKPLPESCYSKKERLSTDLLVIHHLSGIKKFKDNGVIDMAKAYDPQECWNILVDYEVSTHFMIDRDGIEYQLMPVDNVAWACGESEWEGRTGCNYFSVNVELIGSVLDDYTPAQYASLGKLCAKLMSKYGLKWEQVTGHRFISPGRKVDPNKGFDWADLKQALGYINKDMSK